jgi:hypothetical protein
MASTGHWVHAAFASAADARDALQKLATAGVQARDIEVRSSIPQPDVQPVGSRPKTRVPLMAVVGGVVGGTSFFLLVALSSMAYPLPTGGMPIVPMMTTGIIVFEGTAIGAILCTVATVLIEGGLLRFRGTTPRPIDGYLAAGNIIVSVRSDDGATGDWTAQALATDAESEESG